MSRCDTYRAKVGATTYNNFDTDSSMMYSYEADDPLDLPALVTGFYGAGRINHGDFKYTLSGDDNDGVDTKLKAALQSYKSALIGIFE